MHIQDILYYVFWAGLFIVMMRFGCGAHIMGHSHHHTARARITRRQPTSRHLCPNG